MNQPRLVPVVLPPDPEGIALVLHGGASRRDNPAVSPAQLSVLRMIPIARGLARAGRPGRLAVYRLLNSSRGWDVSHTPVQDAHWGLARIAERYPDRPVALVGHSLGGRAALLAGAEPSVRSVVALNPWVYPTDDADLSGRTVLIVHGAADRVANPERSRVVARRLSRNAQVGYVSVPGGKHAMLRHHARFDAYAAQFVAATLLGDSPSGVIARVLDGEHWVTE